MKLNVPILSQRDPQWASQRLGTVDETTIGGYGCLVTCMTMLANYYGHNLTPADMDNWLTDNQGYVQGNLYRNDAFGREFPDCSFDSVTFCTDIPAPLNQIDYYLSQGKPVVVMVDFDHDPTDGIQTHFVLIVGKDIAGNYFINDPWYGDQVYLIARYGENQAQAINQINFFSGPVTQPTPQPIVVPPAPIVEQPVPVQEVTTTQTEIPVTVSTTGQSTVVNISTQPDIVPNDPTVTITSPVEAKPLPTPTPILPRMDWYSTIVFLLKNIFSTLLKKGGK